MPINDLNSPPPFNPPPDPTLKIVTDAPKVKFHRHRKSSTVQLIRISALLVTVVVLAAVAWNNLTSIKAKNKEQQWAMDWVYENEGDPSSVEFIKILGPHADIVYAKYRCTGPLGGPIVHERCFRIQDGGVEYYSGLIYFGPDEPERANPLTGLFSGD